jgi:hypothetical protein
MKNRAKLLLVAGALALFSSTVLAAPKPSALIDEWSALNEKCRGGSGNDPATSEACDKRDAVGAKIRAAGWVYNFPGYPTCASDWHPVTRKTPYRPTCQ